MVNKVRSDLKNNVVDNINDDRQDSNGGSRRINVSAGVCVNGISDKSAHGTGDGSPYSGRKNTIRCEHGITGCAGNMVTGWKIIFQKPEKQGSQAQIKGQESIAGFIDDEACAASYDQAKSQPEEPLALFCGISGHGLQVRIEKLAVSEYNTDENGRNNNGNCTIIKGNGYFSKSGSHSQTNDGKNAGNQENR